MKTFLKTSSFAFMALALLAQGPEGRPRFGGPGFGGPGGPNLLFAGPGSRTPVTGAPYSAAESRVFQQTLPGGNQISRQEQAKVYRDSQGRVRMETTRTTPDGQSHTAVSIFDPVANVSHMLNPATKTVVNTPLPGSRTGGSRPHIPPAAGTDTRQIQSQDLGQQMINGVQATGTRITETIPAGAIGNAQPIQVVRETWISVDLKVPVQITSSDPRFGSSTMNLTNIVRVEPDASLFTVPADYAVSTRTNPRMGGGSLRGQPPAQQ